MNLFDVDPLKIYVLVSPFLVFAVGLGVFFLTGLARSARAAPASGRVGRGG